MTELQLRLSFEAVMAIAHGHEITFYVDEEQLRISLSCDDAAAASFRDQVQQALLELLPTGTLPN